MAVKVQTAATRSGEMWIPRFFADIDEDRCQACGKCANACPRSLIQIENSRLGSCAKNTDPGNCIGCTACMNACPNMAIFCSAKKM